MPLPTPGSSIFAGFDPTSAYVSMPEQGATWGAAAQMFANGDAFASQLFAMADFRNFAWVSRSVLAKQGIIRGVPKWIEQPFATFFGKTPLVNDAKALASGVLQGVVSEVNTALAGCSSAVPIIGAIIRLGMSMYQQIRTALQHEPGAPDVAVVYDAGEDQGNAARLSDAASFEDWTQIFMPISTDPAWFAKNVAWSPGSAAAGVSWTTPARDGLGLLPGIGDQVGLYQMPWRQPGSSRWYDPALTPASTSGTFTPSGRKFSTVLWQAAMKPSIQMFLVDSHAVEDAWDGYFSTLWAFANSSDFHLGTGDRATLVWAIRRAASYAKLVYTKDGPAFAQQSVIEAFTRQQLEAKLGALTWRYSDIVHYVCRIHRERARSALGTLVTAYVPPTAPLLRADPELAQLHQDMRKALLTNDARYDVELALVPDEAYRSALVQARGHSPTGDLVAGGGRKPPKQGTPPVVPLVATWVGGKPPKPEPSPLPGLPDGVGTPRTGGSSAVVVGGVVLAVLAGGALVYRRVTR